MATRIARRRRENLQKRFGESAFGESLIQAAALPAPGSRHLEPYGWDNFPPKGLAGETYFRQHNKRSYVR